MRDILKRLFVLGACILLNLLGVYVSRAADSLLFLDLVGTAFATIAYGPIHGILVGLVTNGLAEIWEHQAHYFQFGIVQVLSAATWGMLPRLLRGKWCTDFFNDGAGAHKSPPKPYDHFELFVGLIWVSLVSHLVASFAIAVLVSSDSSLACSALEASKAPSGDPDVVLCQVAQALFGGDTKSIDHAIFKLASAKAVVGWPDHLIALSLSVLMVAHILPSRRYKMSGAFGHERSAPRIVAAVIGVAFGIFAIVHLLAAPPGRFADFVWWFSYTVAMLLIVLLANKYRMRAWDVPKERYTDVNPDLEPAFEGALRLGLIVSVIADVWVSSRCGESCTGPLKHHDGLEKFTDVLGVAFLITFARYVSLIIARSSRVLQLPGF